MIEVCYCLFKFNHLLRLLIHLKLRRHRFKTKIYGMEANNLREMIRHDCLVSDQLNTRQTNAANTVVIVPLSSQTLAVIAGNGLRTLTTTLH